MQDIKHLRHLSTLMDSQFRLGGFRFGLDGLLGLIPGVGDVVTTGISIYIIAEAARLGCSPATLVRMALNLAFENIVDMVPILGNVFDFLWKANTRNIVLLEKHLADPLHTTHQSRAVLLTVVLSLLGVLFGSLYVTYLIIKAFLVAVQSLGVSV
jgi:hypothetical protein